MIPKYQFSIKSINQNDAVGSDFSRENFFRQLVEYVSLDYSFYWSGSKLRIVAFLG